MVFLHDRPWISPWIKTISNELDITCHVTMVWSLWRHRQSIVTSSAESVKRASETRGWCVKILVLTSFLDSLCRVRNKTMYVLLWWTVYALTRVSNSGNKHQNKPLVTAKTVRHASTYIILYIYLPVLYFHWNTHCEQVRLDGKRSLTLMWSMVLVTGSLVPEPSARGRR